MNPEEIAVIIPARVGSIRVPQKNFRPFAGGPSLLERAITFSHDIGLRDRVVVTTDHETFTQPGVQIVRRQPEIPERPMMAVLSELVPVIAAPFWLLLQPTSPFRQASDVYRCWSRLTPFVDSVITTTIKNGAHTPDGSVYLFRRENLVRYGHLFGRTWQTCRAAEPFTIDTPAQWSEAEARIIRRRRSPDATGPE